jgi:hypothetical protein
MCLIKNIHSLKFFSMLATSCVLPKWIQNVQPKTMNSKITSIPLIKAHNLISRV